MSAILAAAAIALSGAAVAAFVPVRGATRAAFALLFGLGIWSASYAAVLFIAGNTPRTILLKDAVVAAAGAALLIARRGRACAVFNDAQVVESAPGWPRGAAIAAAVIATAFFVEHTFRNPDGGWDAWAIWNLRARFLARSGEDFRAAFSPDLLFWAHQDYPLLVPGIVAQAFLLWGKQPLWIPALVSYALAALCVAVLAGAAAELRRPPWGGLAALALLATPCFVGFAANQQSDVPVAALMLAASALTAFGIESRQRSCFAVAGISASLAAWTKNEGGVYLVCFALGLAAIRWAPARERFRSLVAFACGAAPVVALLIYFKFAIAHVNDLVSEPSAGRLFDVSRWGELGLALARRAIFFQSWGVWLVAEVVVLALVVPRLPPRPAARTLGVALVLAFAATLPIYVLQPHPLLWFFRASIDRVLIQLWPSILLATALAIVPRGADVQEAGGRPSLGELTDAIGASPSPQASANDR